MNFFKRRRFLKNANLLELTPVRLHQNETGEEGRTVLLVPKFKNADIGRFMLGNRAAFFRIKLDDMGSEVWNVIDGKSKVADLISRLQDKWKETPEKTEELERRFAAFLGQLYDNRYITFKELMNEF
jgi:hypothetical protein